MSDLPSLARGCASCRVCEGAAYQTPPVFFAGNPNAPIVAIGQNPGEIKDKDEARQAWMRLFKTFEERDLINLMPLWYTWDFYNSHAHQALGFVFGADWLAKGEIMWTNAVRCRTPGNLAPDSMMEACKTWTQPLISNRKAVIMVGVMARAQVLGSDADKLQWGIPRHHPRFGYIMAIKHYAAWGSEDPGKYQSSFERIQYRIAEDEKR